MRHKDKPTATDDEYVEVTLWEYLRYSKYVRMFLVIVLIGAIAGGFVWEYGQIQQLDSKIEELASYDNYDFETHGQAVTEDTYEEVAQQLRNTKWFKNHKIAEDLLKSSAFNQKKKSYYVIFYKEDCSYCNRLETNMYNDFDAMKKKNIYWVDVENAKEDSEDGINKEKELLWTEDELDDSKLSKKEFAITGTPTMVKVTKGEDNLEVFVGQDTIEEELEIN